LVLGAKGHGKRVSKTINTPRSVLRRIEQAQPILGSEGNSAFRQETTCEKRKRENEAAKREKKMSVVTSGGSRIIQESFNAAVPAKV